MKISIVLAYMFPNEDPDTAWEVRDDGDGPYIDVWNLVEPQPTQAEFEAAWPATQVMLADKVIKQQLLATDAGFIRVIEDLIDVGGDVTKLPQSAKNKVAERKALRAQISGD